MAGQISAHHCSIFEESFGHLAPGAVMDADEQDFFLFHDERKTGR
jgi:hypothetical protein